jgi:hypothetical protein
MQGLQGTHELQGGHGLHGRLGAGVQGVQGVAWAGVAMVTAGGVNVIGGAHGSPRRRKQSNGRHIRMLGNHGRSSGRTVF